MVENGKLFIDSQLVLETNTVKESWGNCLMKIAYHEKYEKWLSSFLL